MPQNYLRTYFIMGSQDCMRDPIDTLEEAINGGITAFQFREKGSGSLNGEAKLTLGKKLRTLCSQHNIPFFINDDVDLIESLQVDGVHVGQNDVSVLDLRKQYPHIQIGLSISDDEELKNSPLDVIDYIGAGPVYSTTSKQDAKKAVGLEWISRLRRLQPDIPIVGIGGINTSNAKDVLQAGANGVAVISAISKSQQIKQDISLL